MPRGASIRTLKHTGGASVDDVWFLRIDGYRQNPEAGQTGIDSMPPVSPVSALEDARDFGAHIDCRRRQGIDDKISRRDLGETCASPSRASINALEHAPCLAGRIGNKTRVERGRNLGVDRNASDSSVSGKARDDGTPCTSTIDRVDEAT